MLAVEADPAPARKKGLHYGFMIIAAGFLTQFVLLCCQRMPALTLENIRVALNISYTEVGLITSWFTVFYAGGAFLWGYLNDAIGAKKTLSLAAAVAAIGLVAFGAFAQNGLLVAVIVWSVAGLGCAGLYMATLPVLIANWFAPKRRGFAMGLITPGGNVCSIVLGLVVPTLVVSSSWQVGFIVVGVFCALVTVFIFAFVRTYPSEKGLAPYGSPAGTQAAPSPNVETLQEEKDARQKPEKDAGHKAGQKAVQKTARLSNFAHVLRSGITWHFGALYTIYQIGYMVSTTYYVASTIYAGYTPVEAGLGITFGGLATVVSLNVFGNLSDRIER
ncbi:MAG: MFS transporter, partial [Coriobacteriales bacterium]|nr:MFS transporter [Coriobacteriales bacterium]